MASLKAPTQDNPKLEDRDQILRQLALDIVKRIESVPDILRKAGITQDELKELLRSGPFKQMMKQAASEWEAAENTPERIKLKSALLIEKSLPDMYGALIDTKEPLAARAALFTTLGKMGGLGHAPPVNGAGGAGGNTFRLEINFTKQPSKNIVIEHSALPSEVMPHRSEFADDADINDELSA